MAKAVSIESLLSGLVDASGNPLASGKLYSYEIGTTTPKSIYSDKGATSALDNPLTLGANGVYQAYAYGSYKFVIKTAADATVYTWDNLEFSPGVSTWVPTFTASGSMTISASTLYQAFYIEMGELVFHSFSGYVTTAGSASTTIYYTLPVSSNNSNTPFAAGSLDTGVGGIAALSDTTKGLVERYDRANWSIGATKLVAASGWYRRA